MKPRLYIHLILMVFTFLMAIAFIPAQTIKAEPTCSGTPGDVDQCNTLAALYNSTDGPNWTNNTNWETSTDYCTWYGIVCDGSSNVTNISLNSNNLSGTIPDWSALIYVQHIGLHSNNLSGSIPDWSTLTNLVGIYLWDNDLSGSIPDWSNLTNLQAVALGGNNLDGEIPDWSMLTNLWSMQLQYNNLDGSIPDWSNLTDLSALYLSWNDLDGSIPEWPKSATGTSKLQSINIDNNQLQGTIPDLSPLTNLQQLNLQSNYLSGPIPDWAMLTNLSYLNLRWNGLSGFIPDWSTLSSLQHIYLDWNHLDGSIPDWSNLTDLRAINLWGNDLSGTIPDWSALTHLEFIYLGENRLMGGIPDMTNLITLYSMQLHDNQLSGPIPESIVNTLILESSTGYYLDLTHNIGLTAGTPSLEDWLNARDPNWSESKPVANNDNYSTDYQTTLAVSTPGVLGNDTDANLSPMTATQLTSPSHAKTFSFSANGSFIYTPLDGFSGTDSFTYKAIDDTNGQSQQTTVIISVASVAAPTTSTPEPTTPTPEPTDEPTPDPTPDAATPPTALKNLAAEVAYGKPVISWDQDYNATWFNIWIGGGTGQVHYEWYPLDPSEIFIADQAEISCTEGVCTVKPHLDLVAGTYQIWIQTWGPGGMSTGGSSGYDGWSDTSFVLPNTAPGAVQAMTATHADSSEITLGWTPDENATWYNVWLGTGSPDWTPYLFDWISAEDLGCFDDNFCFLEEGVDLVIGGSFSLNLPSGSYVWYVRSWGPGGFSTGGVAGAEEWAQGPDITVP